MKNLVSWLALVLSVLAISISLWPNKSITTEKIVLKDGDGITRAIFDANRNVVASFFSDDKKEMMRITVLSDGSQIDLQGEDGRQRVRLSTWGSNYLSIMDKEWNKRVHVGDYWVLTGNEPVKQMGLSFEKDGKPEVVFKIPE